VNLEYKSIVFSASSISRRASKARQKRRIVSISQQITANTKASNMTHTFTLFTTTLLSPAQQSDDAPWFFVVLPKDVSATLPRRGRTTVTGNLNGQPFQVTLEPDGQLSHWLQISDELREAANASIGDSVTLEIAPLKPEPEPQIPPDFQAALTNAPAALAAWNTTTTLARVDWIHWMVSAKQAKTRAQRIANACDMLAAGKLRVCCFDESGYYSKAFRAPAAK
jgi:hypothetical protein